MPVFIAGGTGYIGRRVIAALLQRGCRVRALVRSGSERRLPHGCEVVQGNVLDRATYMTRVSADDVVVHLVGTPHPSPAKARQFREIDLASAREMVAVASAARVRHFVYVSVAQPAPVMHAYIAARSEAETVIRESGLPATILRPWYVLGPGHRWPYVLVPLYWLLERLPSTRASALRLGLVTIDQMTRTIVNVVGSPPPPATRIVTVPEIRAAALAGAGDVSRVAAQR